MSRGALWPVLAAALLVATTGSVPGTDAVSSLRAERGVGGQVAADERAYLAIEDDDVTASGHERGRELLAVTNRLGERVDLRVEVRDATPTGYVSRIEAPSRLGAGESGAVVADLDCAARDDRVTVALRVRAAGDDADVTVWREATVDCRDSGGLVALDAPDATTLTGDGAPVLTVSNRAGEPVSVEVTARRPEGDDPHPNVTVVGTPAPVTVASGERASIDAACDAAGDATVELVVVAWTTDDDDDRVTTASTTVNASCAA